MIEDGSSICFLAADEEEVSLALKLPEFLILSFRSYQTDDMFLWEIAQEIALAMRTLNCASKLSMDALL